MLERIIQDWNGTVEIDGKKFDTSSTFNETLYNANSIILHSHKENTVERKIARFNDTGAECYRVTVKQYMTKTSTPEFNFMSQWNNDVPMPLRTMIGSIEKETSGMVYMKLHGDITSRVTQYCLKCGREITNPVSQYFGMGPECGSHNYINPFETEEELAVAIENYRKNYLQKITWEGWIIKSAIIEMEEFKDEDNSGR